MSQRGAGRYADFVSKAPNAWHCLLATLSPLPWSAHCTQHLKQRTAHALEEVAVLRDELDRTEAAVVGGKKKRDCDVAEREGQLRHCQEEIRRLESEVRVDLGLKLTREGW